MTKVCVVGLGKAGLPLACVVADSGMSVVGLDIDKKRIEGLRNKINPVPEEPGIDEILKQTVGKNFSFECEYSKVKDCNVYIVIVPLFIDDEKLCDFSILKSAFNEVGALLDKGDLVVLETTVPPTTTQTLVKSILEEQSGLSSNGDFYLAYSPERIMTGYSISRYKEFPKVAGGLTPDATKRAVEIYSNFCTKVKPVKNCRTAELIKVAEGIYRDSNIAIANELIKVCDNFDVNFWEMRANANHQFCNILEGGNVGGHCIPVYPWFIINEMTVPLMQCARSLNDGMVNYYARKVAKIAGSEGKVGIVGLSYREGVKEKAYTRSIPMISALKSKGFDVLGLDPMYDESETKKTFGVNQIKSFEDLKCVLVMNKYPQFKEELLAISEKVVDVRNMLELK